MERIKAVPRISHDRVGKGRLPTYLRLSMNSLLSCIFRLFVFALLSMKHVERSILARLIQPPFHRRGIRTVIPKALCIRAVRSISANCGQPSLPIIEQTRLEPDTDVFDLQRLVHSLESQGEVAEACFGSHDLFRFSLLKRTY